MRVPHLSVSRNTQDRSLIKRKERNTCERTNVYFIREFSKFSKFEIKLTSAFPLSNFFSLGLLKTVFIAVYNEISEIRLRIN